MLMNPNSPYIPDLTEQECQILALMVKDDGRKNKARAIASDLNISDNYVYHMQRQLRFKSCVAENIQLVVRAIQMGIISADGTVVKRNSKSSHNSTEHLLAETDAAYPKPVNSGVNSSLHRVEFSTDILHSDEEGDYFNRVNSGVNSSLHRDVIEWLGANQHRAGLTALITRAIQEGVIAPPPDKEHIIIDWLHANPDKAHLGSRTIAALIGDVSHTYVDRVRKRDRKSRNAPYQQLGV